MSFSFKVGKLYILKQSGLFTNSFKGDVIIYLGLGSVTSANRDYFLLKEEEQEQEKRNIHQVLLPDGRIRGWAPTSYAGKHPEKFFEEPKIKNKQRK